MQRVIDFLIANPLVLLILFAWVAGMIGNIGKAAKKARERTERTERTRSATPAQQPQHPQQPPAREPGTRSAEEVAQEMRRILGLDPEHEEEQPSEPPPQPRPLSKPPAPLGGPSGSVPQEVGRRELAAERPPTPVMPTTQERRIVTHVDPHVGERIARRAVQGGLVGKHEPSPLGTLGGRVSGPARARRKSVRYSLDDVQKALVLNEILGKPLALRELDDRFV